jgi:hypothetical protein
MHKIRKQLEASHMVNLRQGLTLNPLAKDFALDGISLERADNVGLDYCSSFRKVKVERGCGPDCNTKNSNLLTLDKIRH